VDGISFGGQMHGLVLLDWEDQVIRPAILWNDGRAVQETAWLNREIGEDRLSALTGNIAFAGFTAPKLLWVRAHERERFSRIDKIMLPKDFLAYRMTGVHSTDYSDAAGTLLLDTAHKQWSAEMLRICGFVQSSFRCSGKAGRLPAPAAGGGPGTGTAGICAGVRRAGDNARPPLAPAP
jgi:xylulokinase